MIIITNLPLSLQLHGVCQPHLDPPVLLHGGKTPRAVRCILKKTYGARLCLRDFCRNKHRSWPNATPRQFSVCDLELQIEQMLLVF